MSIQARLIEVTKVRASNTVMHWRRFARQVIANPLGRSREAMRSMRSAEITSLLSGIVLVSFCLFLIGLAVVIAATPTLAERFLTSFARSARAHYTEQGSRLLVGAAMVNFAPSMWFPDLFKLFGWLLVITAVVLLLTPWEWHHRFGKWAIPLAIRHLRLFAIGAFTLGALILFGISRVVIA